MRGDSINQNEKNKMRKGRKKASGSSGNAHVVVKGVVVGVEEQSSVPWDAFILELFAEKEREPGSMQSKIDIANFNRKRRWNILCAYKNGFLWIAEIRNVSRSYQENILRMIL
ncbi:hypothetical protein AVEN_173611-1 [Araneus ventricosus]|uniref:Uncharacterized protein n=1 Tax=Araneus ventricosus TaxID=182803 RepID=A0A4Y2CT44_ARAVE|nr:hypothetical protein AVEN_173611-1 [Araneus ventricosus]